MKPDNILMNARGDVELSDFGCVNKLKSYDDYLTRVTLSVRFIHLKNGFNVLFNMAQNQIFHCLKF